MLADRQTDTQTRRQTHRQMGWSKYSAPLMGRSKNEQCTQALTKIMYQKSWKAILAGRSILKDGISVELLTVSKDDDSFVEFVLWPPNRNFFSNEESCTVRCFIPLRTGRVRIVGVKFNHSKLFLAVCENVIHRDVLGRSRRLYDAYATL